MLVFPIWRFGRQSDLLASAYKASLPVVMLVMKQIAACDKC